MGGLWTMWSRWLQEMFGENTMEEKLQQACLPRMEEERGGH